MSIYSSKLTSGGRAALRCGFVWRKKDLEFEKPRAEEGSVQLLLFTFLGFGT